MKNMRKVLLLASVISVLVSQVILASEIALADNKRESPAQMDSSESKETPRIS